MSAHMAGLRHPEFDVDRPSSLADVTPENRREVTRNRYDNGLRQADAVIPRRHSLAASTTSGP